MNKEAIKFITEVVKPWEILNKELSKPYSVNPDISDYTSRANSLAVSIKHFPESSRKMIIKKLITESRSYEIMSDLADSSKHGKLDKKGRECGLKVASMFERNDEGKVRFLRNVVTIQHNTYGKVDFMNCAMEAAIFVLDKLDIKTNWVPKLFINNGEFSDEVKVHASISNQVMWSGMQLQFVKLNENGGYENVDLNSMIKFMLTSEFKPQKVDVR